MQSIFHKDNISYYIRDTYDLYFVLISSFFISVAILYDQLSRVIRSRSAFEIINVEVRSVWNKKSLDDCLSCFRYNDLYYQIEIRK